VSNIGAIVLAAGASTRLGKPKQLLSYKGETLIRRAAQTVLGARCLITTVVVGANAQLVSDELRDMPLQIITNADWPKGMSSSIRAGLKVVIENFAQVDAVLLTTCDQPLITSQRLNELILRYDVSHAPIVASSYSNTLGVPALFDRSQFPQLLSLCGKQGAKHLFQNRRVEKVDCPEGAFDIDTVNDYLTLTSDAAT